MNYPHPQKRLVSRDIARAWPDKSARLTRKIDGQFSQFQINGSVLLGELVKDKSGALFTSDDRALIAKHGEFFAAFDCAVFHGLYVLNYPLNVRHAALLSTMEDVKREKPMTEVVLAELVTDIDAVFAAGGEGVCRNAWDSPYGFMEVCKNGIIVECRVTGVGSTQSITIADDGGDLGKCPAKGGAADRVRIGSIVRVEALSMTDDHKLREPKLCREFLVRY